MINSKQRMITITALKIMVVVGLLLSSTACGAQITQQVTTPTPTPATIEKKNVLVLYAYQSDLISTQISANAIREEIDKSTDLQVGLFFEYLDLGRFSDQHFQESLVNLLHEKYSHKSIDLVIIANQLMLKWWPENRGEILPETPVVFFDVENRNFQGLHLPSDFTGVGGVVDYVQSVNWYKSVRPTVNEIVIIHGMGSIDLNEFNYLPVKLLEQEFSGKLNVTDISSLSLVEIKKQISSLPPTSVVVYHLMFEDADGISQQPIKILQELTAVSSVPILGAFDQFIGEGLVGGYMYSIDRQAREAVGTALRILKGEEPSGIPVSIDRTNVFIFDHAVLQRFNIPLSSIPENAIIKNRDYSFWELYQFQIVAFAIAGVVLLVMVVFLILFSNRLVKARQLLINLNENLETQIEERISDLRETNSNLEMEITERKQVEAALRKSETKYRLLAENIVDVVWIMDISGIFQYVSPSVYRLRGFTPEEVLDQTLDDVLTPEGLQLISKELPRRLLEFSNGDESAHVRIDQLDQYHKNGSIVPTEVITTLITNDQGQVTQILGVSRDITIRRKIEQAEKNQRTMAEALRDIARTLNSTLDFNGVLDEIMKNIWRVVPIASANIALLEEKGKLRYSHFTGYKEHTVPEENVKIVEFSLEKSSIYRTVYETGQPLIISNTNADPRWIAFPGSEWIRSYAVMPIRIKNKVVGFLNLDSPTVGMYTSEHIETLLAFADQAAIAIENAQLYAEVQEHAITDGLTGVINRRGLFQMGEREVQRTIRFQHQLTAIMFDIDHFKSVNDTYGHPIGDRILCVLAKCCQDLVRNVDIVTRYGGDEFVLLLTETDIENGARVAERLRKEIEQTEVSVEGDENSIGTSIHVTISMGVTKVLLDSDDIQSLIKRADQALYFAKEAGRNQIKVL